ncbi:MAG: hypothetical protein QF460_02885 [Candidatus Nanoarchaeia archaeon]|nr:hypothetical protein [Candidatus Nanoarchaeia archaeon]
MIINKKGISAVVANVLIVLLVVASVAIIWAVVRPTIEQAGEGIEAGCFTVQVNPESCNATGANGYGTLTIYRRAGIGEITSFKLLVEDNAGDIEVFDGTAGKDIAELETQIINATSYGAEFNKTTNMKVDIALVIGENICEPSGVPVTCR